MASCSAPQVIHPLSLDDDGPAAGILDENVGTTAALEGVADLFCAGVPAAAEAV